MNNNRPAPPREVQLLINSADRMKRTYAAKLFDKLNIAFLKKEAWLHLRITLNLLRKLYFGSRKGEVTDEYTH